MGSDTNEGTTGGQQGTEDNRRTTGDGGQQEDNRGQTTVYVNRTYRRSGKLWEGRFRSCLTQEETYLLACQRYIELNPVRADMVAHPAEYRWSSYRANAQGEADALLKSHPLYDALGTGAASRQAAYREGQIGRSNGRRSNGVRHDI